MEIHASGINDFKTVKALNKAAVGVKNFAALGVYALVFALFTYQMLSPRYAKNAVNYILYAFCAALFVYFIVLCVNIPKRAYKRMGRNAGTVGRYTFTDDGMTVAASTDGYEGETTVSYDHILRVIDTPEYFFLFISGSNAWPVDKSTFEGGTPEQLTEKLRANVKKYKVKR